MRKPWTVVFLYPSTKPGRPAPKPQPIKTIPHPGFGIEPDEDFWMRYIRVHPGRRRIEVTLESV